MTAMAETPPALRPTALPDEIAKALDAYVTAIRDPAAQYGTDGEPPAFSSVLEMDATRHQLEDAIRDALEDAALSRPAPADGLRDDLRAIVARWLADTEPEATTLADAAEEIACPDQGSMPARCDAPGTREAAEEDEWTWGVTPDGKGLIPPPAASRWFAETMTRWNADAARIAQERGAALHEIAADLRELRGIIAKGESVDPDSLVMRLGDIAEDCEGALGTESEATPPPPASETLVGEDRSAPRQRESASSSETARLREEVERLTWALKHEGEKSAELADALKWERVAFEDRRVRLEAAESRATAAEARLAEVERERDGLRRDLHDLATGRLHAAKETP